MIEFAPTPESKDTDDDSSESNPSDSRSRRTSRNRRIGTYLAKNIGEAPNIHRARGPESEKASVRRELVKPAAEKQDEASRPKAEKEKATTVSAISSQEKSPWGVQNQGEVSRASDEAALAARANRREDEESDEDEEEAPIEGIGRKKEKREVARRIADASESEAIEVLAETPEGASQEDKAAARAEASASVALMEAFKENMADDPDADVEQILDKSADAIIEKIKNEDSDKVREDEPTGSNKPSEHNEGELPLRENLPDDEDGTVIIPLSGNNGNGTGGSTGAGGSNGPGGPTGPGSNGPNGPGGPGGPGGNTPPPGGPNTPPPGGPNVPPPGPNVPPLPPISPAGPPYGPNFGPPPGPTGPNFNTAPSPQPGISQEELNAIVHRHERTALAQGLLVGGIIGYLIGRRRGRIKTEKRLLPIQEKLEKQVEGLQSAIIAKEQTVRRMAAERANELTTQEEKEKFANRLARAEDIRAKAEAARREKQTNRQKITETARQERLGQMLVEAPTAVIAGTAAAAGFERGVHASRSEVDFSKKVENYTEPELRLAAEKIRIDGTTLKELWDGGRLNERAVKRVMQEFIEGRSVRAALTKELLEHDLRIEKDPKLRDAMARQAADGAADSGGAAVKTAAAGASMLLRNMESSQEAGQAVQGTNNANSSQWQAPEKLSPQQKKSLLDKVKEDPKVQVAGVVTFVLILIAAALIFA